jgi:hypothetical protein
MKFSTPVELPKVKTKMQHTDRIMVIGSCFSEHIGTWLQQEKFRCLINPFGILYNPISIHDALERIMEGRPFTQDELEKGDDGLWHSMMHHGSFSGADPDKVLVHINESLREAHDFLKQADWLFITLGTAVVYEDKKTRKVVGNCHHFPAKRFEKKLLNPLEINVRLNSTLVNLLSQFNPGLNMVYTVSPIRHPGDGLHVNQVSKGSLLAGMYDLESVSSEFYFPAYEIMMDELRDYRFYADDMLHPSPAAIQYIQERFAETYFSRETKAVLKEWDALRLALAHRPIHPESEANKKFLRQNMLKLIQLKEKFPYFELEKEIAQCKALLEEV